ncbi:Protein of unknown function [Gryllus bimaculatus]|nr:Protein of unknown function [Gryllus bimaculatus]
MTNARILFLREKVNMVLLTMLPIHV